MTKFILHGGHAGDENSDNHSFFKEMTQGSKKKINFLINGFACDYDKVDDKFRRHADKFRNFSKDKKINFKLSELDKFSAQLKWADVIYIEGGAATEGLVKKLSLTKNLDKLLEGKVIGGSSAGVNCLAKYYFGNTSQKIGKGLGILNIKTYCHYDPKDKKVIEKLASYKEKLPLLVLQNYKWVVMYK